MNRIEVVAARHERSATLLRNGVELDIVRDPLGARFNNAIRTVLLLARDDSSGLLDNLLGAAKALRWRLLTQPPPVQVNAALRQSVVEVRAEAVRVRSGFGSQAQHALDELVAAAESVAATDIATGGVLLDLIQEANAEDCVVIAVSGSAVAGLESWLGQLGYRVRSVSQLIREQLFVEYGYAVGPPRFFPASLVNAPLTEALNFVFPEWFGDRSLPCSVLAERAEGAVIVSGRPFLTGHATEPSSPPTANSVDEAELLPQASWVPPGPKARKEPGTEEASARRVLLSGAYGTWLEDDGDWIRTVDPSQPGGGRIMNVDLEDVRPGTYLLLRDGETERQALYAAALMLMGSQAKVVEESQAKWKGALREQLNKHGRTHVVRKLADAGVKSSYRAEAWTEPMLARPRSDQDFERLLRWLGIDFHPAYDLATAMRRKRAQAIADIADQLEEVVAAADMSLLERNGHLRLELQSPGFRGVIATRVLSISPHVEVIARHEARVLHPDRSAKWLE